MAVKYPNVNDVKMAFANAFPAVQGFDEERWTKLYKSLMNPAWQSAGEGIEVVRVEGVRLFRVQREFSIDNMDTRSEAMLRSGSNALKNRLTALFAGEPVSLDPIEYQVEEKGRGYVVRCLTRGIIG